MNRIKDCIFYGTMWVFVKIGICVETTFTFYPSSNDYTSTQFSYSRKRMCYKNMDRLNDN